MNTSYKQHEVLRWASLFLEKHHREPGVAELLLQHYLGVSRSVFYAQMQEPVSKDVLQSLETDLRQHVTTGIPVQHLLGRESFYGRTFEVNQHVLIPRPETEELIVEVMNTVKTKQKEGPLTIVDVGTGSGVIAITLALEIPHAAVYATDISEKALKVARKNADTHQANVTFLQGDFLSPIIDQRIIADLVVSNPPYISETDIPALSDTVKHFDPPLALFAAGNGLAAYQSILSQVPSCLKENGAIIFEIGHGQGEDVCALVKQTYPKSNPVVIKDINKHNRIVSCTV